jgi:hypothetical protein
MTGGYLVEKEFRRAMAPRTWDRMLTPICAVAFGLTLMMAVLGLKPVRPTQPQARSQRPGMVTLVATDARSPSGLA